MTKRTLLLSMLVSWLASSAWSQSYEVGTGIYDITGRAGERFALGHSVIDVKGLHQRLFARAFVVHQPATGKRLAFVNIDFLQVDQSVKLEVTKRLQQRVGLQMFNDTNVMISATHTHMAQSGIAHHSAYNLFAELQYSETEFDIAVDGIVNAIERANNNLAPGAISFNQGEVTNGNKNRSLDAYLANDAVDAINPTETQMNVLKFVKDTGEDIGLISWFALHNTSFSNKYHYITGDARGYASYQTEKHFNGNTAQHLQDEGFVAAYASTNQGDVVSFQGNANSEPGFTGLPGVYSEGDENNPGFVQAEFENVSITSAQQVSSTLALYDSAEQLNGENLDYRFKWVQLGGLSVEDEYTHASVGAASVCRYAMTGLSITAGAENGPGDQSVREGQKKGDADIPFGTAFKDCQGNKPLTLPVDFPDFAVPHIMPVQLFVIDSIAIIGLPGEITTQLGRRIKQRVLNSLAGSGVEHAIIAGYANGYFAYSTTYEEFQAQHYEGASTMFGVHQGAAFEQLADELAKDIASNQSSQNTATPSYRPAFLSLPDTVVLVDKKPWYQSFGSVLQNTASSYQLGDTVSVSFRSGHPKNEVKTQNSLLYVQKLTSAGNWQTVSRDWDWDTTYEWRREGDCDGCSTAIITWRIPAEAESGNYRITHQGKWKPLFGSPRAYQGFSNNFVVTP